MKKYRAILVILIFPFFVQSQSVSINNDGSLPDPSAMLDIKSTNKGLLMPRMSTIQRTTMISSPVAGLKVFDTDTKTFWFYNGTGWIESATGSPTNFWTLNGTNIFNSNSGNVGIGTNSPLHKFTVQSAYDAYGLTHTDGNIRISTYIGQGQGAWFGTASNHKLHIYTNSNGTPNITFNPNFITHIRGIKPRMEFYDETGGQFNLSGDVRSNSSNLEIAAYKSTIFGIPGNLLLQVSEPGGPFTSEYYAGNVGIGTSLPDYKLTIGSDIIQGNNNTHVLRLKGRNPVLSFSNENNISYGYIKMWSNAPFAPYTNGMVIGASPGYPIFFSTNNYGVTMTVADNGNVGIGTTNPTHKLSVNGNIRTKEVVVETGWADYVFDDNYKLPSLLEVDKFIQQHKHLPNIPSAKDVEANGLHLGDIQKRMMEKIEELTLYVIDLKKELEVLKMTKAK